MAKAIPNKLDNINAKTNNINEVIDDGKVKLYGDGKKYANNKTGRNLSNAFDSLEAKNEKNHLK